MILGTSQILLGSSKFIWKQSFLANQKEIILQNVNDPYLKTYLKNIKRIPDITFNYLSSFLIKRENIFIDIKQTEFDKIINARNKAFTKSILITSKEDIAKANISKGGETLRAKIRLKGDRLNHLAGKKWSYRIKIRDNKSVYGMRKFSLQSPQTRNYFSEFIFHLLLKDEGLPSLRYKFVELYINGKNLGTYALEEHFDKILIENNKFREGPILSLDENPYWLEASNSIGLKSKEPNNFDEEVLTRSIEVFKEKQIFANPKLKNQYFLGVNLLERFLNNDLKTSEVFEIKKLASFIAIVDLTGSEHSLYWNNMRFYLNPVTKKFIPIGFDAQGGNKILNLSNNKGALARFFEDENFVKEYLKALERISKNEFWDEFLKRNNTLIKKELKYLKSSYHWYRFDKKYINHNQQVIRKLIFPKSPINAHIEQNNNDQINISVSNRQSFPIQILNLNFGNIIYKPKTNYILSTRSNFNIPFYEKLEFERKVIGKRINKDIDPSDQFVLKYKVLGTSKVLSTVVRQYPKLSFQDSSKDIMRKNSNSFEFDFLDHDHKKKIITIKKGNWLINYPLIVPSGYTLKANKDVKLTLSKDGLILLRGPIELVGTKDNLITINAKDGGKGILVLNANGLSKIENVLFENLSFPYEKAWGITSSVTFYQSPVNISNARFSSNNSEDALNIIRSKFDIKDSYFYNIKSDAIDIDFGEGTLINLKFNDIGNDAIDISGTDIFLENAVIKNVGDKAISVGEASNFRGNNIYISESAIGFASKDNSIIEANEITIINSALGFAAFQKKPEFGPGTIIINTKNKDNLKLFNIPKLYLLEKDSSISINNKNYSPNVENVFDYLYGRFYGKETIR
ncbi:MULTISPECIES: CotH kinase family protein [Prochlorococcus]|uniref:CotH kinase family protein n=1 Tax=Prochlorococcus TaxID=1218 RepID=UPI00187CA1B2|nr:CotH kinase family protein [Prochlorococcus marinus]